MTIGHSGMLHPSLAGMVAASGCKVSRVALHRRFSTAAVALMQKALNAVLLHKFSNCIQIQSHLLDFFSRVLIFDSSGWDISPLLSAVFPGSGGGASGANCKLQVCYEYKAGVLSFFDITSGIVPDTSYTKKLPHHVRKGDLVLMDLGYFCLQTFHAIVETGAFFVSRFLGHTALFNPVTGAQIDIVEYLSKSESSQCELNVMMGSDVKMRVPCRLICLRVSEEIANARRRHLHARAKKAGHTTSQKHLLLADWTLMVTNVSPIWLPLEMVRPFYTLRWQIELLFKQLKSVLRIQHSNTGKENRIRCEIYGKLIVAVIIHRIHSYWNTKYWNESRKEVSMDKLYKRLQERIFGLLTLFQNSYQLAIKHLELEIKRIVKYCFKSTQPNRPTTLEILERSIEAVCHLPNAA